MEVVVATARSRAPEIPDNLEWLNIDAPVTLAAQTGRLVLLDFCNFSSIHCLHVLSEQRYLNTKYRDDLLILAVHCPKFPGERYGEHVQKAISRHHIRYPVIHDPEMRLWKAYGVRSWPTQVLIDRNGCIVGAQSGEGKVRQLDSFIQKLLAGMDDSASHRHSSVTIRPKPETGKELSFPGRVIAAGNKVCIADSGHNRILVTSHNGQVLRQYGTSSAGFFDGKGIDAAFDDPHGMVLVDDYLYVADTGNHAIRRINLHTDAVDTIAGTGIAALQPVNGVLTAITVDLNSPGDLAYRDGTLYITMTGLHQIWRLSLLDRTIEVFSGSGKEGLVDGKRQLAAFAQPSGVAVIRNKLYVTDAEASAVRCVDVTTGVVTTLVGKGLFEYGDSDGPGTTARLQFPLAVGADQARNTLWIADTYNNKIKKISLDDKSVSSIAINWRLDEPGGLVFHDDTLYIANTNSHEILRVTLHDKHAEALNVQNELADF
jgi:sugar lactone lactonase YvrE